MVIGCRGKSSPKTWGRVILNELRNTLLGAGNFIKQGTSTGATDLTGLPSVVAADTYKQRWRS